MLKITLNFPDQLVGRVKPGYFHEHPNTEVDDEGVLLYNDLQHFKRSIIKHVISEANNGDKKIYGKARVPIPEDSIT